MTHTDSERTIEIDDDFKSHIGWPMHGTQFEDRRKYASTMMPFGWFAVLAALAAVVMGASLAFAT